MTGKTHVAVRLDEETVARLDAIQPLLDSAWRGATRSDVLRLLLLSGLEQFEKKHAGELGASAAQGKKGAKAPAARAKRSRKKSPPPAG